MDLVAKRDQVRAAWRQEKQEEKHAGTTWRQSHEWDWREGCTDYAGFAVVHHKIVGVLG
jgi:hypothetical protein